MRRRKIRRNIFLDNPTLKYKGGGGGGGGKGGGLERDQGGG